MTDDERHGTVEHGLWKALREKPGTIHGAIAYRLESDGSFTVADADTGLAMNAAPRSGLSESAKQDQASTAREMAAYMTSPTHQAAREAAPDYWQAQDADCRARLEGGKLDGSTREVPARLAGHLEVSAGDPEGPAPESMARWALQDAARAAAGGDGAVLTVEAMAANPWNAVFMPIADTSLYEQALATTERLCVEAGAAWSAHGWNGDAHALDCADNALHWLRLESRAAQQPEAPGLPHIGAPREAADADPRRRAADTEQGRSTSRVEADVIRGIGRKLEREQRAIYQDESLKQPERAEALEANLHENLIAGWERPAMTAGRAIDTGRMRPPLLDRIRDRQAPAEQRAAEGLRAKAMRYAAASSSAKDEGYSSS